jgi:hypothetical protein
LGLAGRIEERRRINESADGLLAFLDRARAERANGRASTSTHPLMSDRDGIDDLRRRWYEQCLNIRARIYDRRLGQLDTEIAGLRWRLERESDAVERARLNGEMRTLQQRRRDETERRRTDSDPSLRCVPAELAPVCSRTSNEDWCNPDLRRPREFVDEVAS